MTKLATVGHPSWIAPTLQNSWTNYSSISNQAGYYRDQFGIVHLRGLITGGTTTVNTTLFTLPSGYRPAYNQLFVTRASNASKTAEGAARVDVWSNGEVKIVTGDVASFGTGAWVSLDGLHFSTKK